MNVAFPQQHQRVFLANSFHRMLLSLSVSANPKVIYDSAERNGLFSSLPSNLQHLGLHIRSLTLGNNLPIIFWHLECLITELMDREAQACCTPWGVQSRTRLRGLNWIELRMNGFINPPLIPSNELQYWTSLNFATKYDVFQVSLKYMIFTFY